MRVVAGDLADWYVDGDESAALVGDQVIVLSPLGTAIVEVLAQQPEQPVEVDMITAVLQRRFGVPAKGTADDAVREALEALAAVDVVRIGACGRA